jgi:branched-chain amino acid transport system substrate-binding protein
LIGSTIVPNSLAMIDVAAETSTPTISLAAAASIVEPMDKRAWVFRTPQNDALMAAAIVQSMVEHRVRTAGFIGFADAYGKSWLARFRKDADKANIKLVASERFARNGASLTGEVLKIVSQNPDAVLIAGAGTPAALPQEPLKERRYKGLYYQTHGVVNSRFSARLRQGLQRHVAADWAVGRVRAIAGFKSGKERYVGVPAGLRQIIRRNDVNIRR